MNEIAIRSLQAQIVGLREKLDKFETYYVHQDLLLGEQEKVATLEQRVKELETALFAATATVASLEDKLADVERERDAYKQDIHDEAGLLMVDVPEPGTDMAKVMRANRLMRHSRDRLRNSLFKLDAMTPKHPREITWEKGTEILNYVQGELLPQLWTKQALKEERSGR